MDAPKQRRSWIDQAIAGVERLPGPSWLAYLVVAAILVVAGTLLAWSDGTVETGHLSFVRVFTDASVLYQLAVMHYLMWSARDALASFAPALGALAPQRDRLEQRLTRMPIAMSLVAIVLGVGYAAGFLFGDPAGVGLSASSSGPLWTFVAVTTVVNGVFFAALVLFVVRQMVTIVEIHARASDVSIFDARSHGAFARLTLRASVGLVLPVYVFTIYQLVTGNPDGEITAPEIVTVVALVVGAIGVFFIPLAGIHRRLVRQKSELISAANVRFAAATREIHAKAEKGSLAGMDDLERLIAALVAEREVLKKLSTWPWEAETLRGFLSSIALPILVWIITNLLGRVLGS